MADLPVVPDVGDQAVFEPPSSYSITRDRNNYDAMIATTIDVATGGDVVTDKFAAVIGAVIELVGPHGGMLRYIHVDAVVRHVLRRIDGGTTLLRGPSLSVQVVTMVYLILGRLLINEPPHHDAELFGSDRELMIMTIRDSIDKIRPENVCSYLYGVADMNLRCRWGHEDTIIDLAIVQVGEIMNTLCRSGVNAIAAPVLTGGPFEDDENGQNPEYSVRSFSSSQTYEDIKPYIPEPKWDSVAETLHLGGETLGKNVRVFLWPEHVMLCEEQDNCIFGLEKIISTTHHAVGIVGVQSTRYRIATRMMVLPIVMT